MLIDKSTPEVFAPVVASINYLRPLAGDEHETINRALAVTPSLFNQDGFEERLETETEQGQLN